MAGSIVAAASIAGGAPGPQNCPKPAGTTTNDVMIAFHATDWDTAAAMTATGWIQLGVQDPGTNQPHLKVWGRDVAAGDSSTTSYAFGQGASADAAATIVTVRGVTLTGAVVVTAAAATDTAAPYTFDAPTVSGATAGAVLLCAAALPANSAANTWTPPTSMTEQGDVQSQGLWVSLGVASLLNPASPSGAKTFTATTPDDGRGAVTASVVLLATTAPPTGVPARTRGFLTLL